MGFIDKLALKDPASTRQAPTRKAVLYLLDDATGQATPVTAGQLGGGGGSGADPGSAREATLELVRLVLADTNTHAQAANGNSYILASQAQGAGLKVQAAPVLVPLSRITLALTAAAQALPARPAGTTAARISVRGGSASVATVAPVAVGTEGDLWGDGSIWELSAAELPGFSAITAAGSPKLSITWLGAGS